MTSLFFRYFSVQSFNSILSKILFSNSTMRVILLMRWLWVKTFISTVVVISFENENNNGQWYKSPMIWLHSIIWMALGIVMWNRNWNQFIVAASIARAQWQMYSVQCPSSTMFQLGLLIIIHVYFWYRNMRFSSEVNRHIIINENDLNIVFHLLDCHWNKLFSCNA